MARYEIEPRQREQRMKMREQRRGAISARCAVSAFEPYPFHHQSHAEDIHVFVATERLKIRYSASVIYLFLCQRARHERRRAQMTRQPFFAYDHFHIPHLCCRADISTCHARLRYFRFMRTDHVLFIIL